MSHPTIITLLLTCSLAIAQTYYPPTDNSAWQRITPTQAGANPTILEQSLTIAEQGNSRGVVILKNGYIVSERYWNGWNATTTGPSYSVAKSFIATLIGAAIEDGYITGVNQPSAHFLNEWSGDPNKESITIGDHLAMTTGLEARSPLLLSTSISERSFASRADSEYLPNIRWLYDTSAFRLSYYILEEATGINTDLYAKNRIFDRIGMSNSTLQIREEELLDTTILNYQYLNFTTLDAARFGLLVRHDGLWNQDQVINANWMQNMRQPINSFSPWYGQLWWLNNSNTYQIPSDEQTRKGPLIPDAPPDLSAALGFNDQKIYIIPSLDLVIVRLGEAADQAEFALSSFDNQFLGTICKAFGYQPRQQTLTSKISVSNNTYEISWDTWNGRTYELETSPNMLPPWTSLTEKLGGGLPVTVTGTATTKQFFRIKTQTP